MFIVWSAWAWQYYYDSSDSIIHAINKYKLEAKQLKPPTALYRSLKSFWFQIFSPLLKAGCCLCFKYNLIL